MRWLLLGILVSGCDAGIDVIASVNVDITGDGSSARVAVSAVDQNGEAVSGALVDVGGSYLVENGGVYGAQVAWGASWDVTIQWHGNLVRRHVGAPAGFALTVTPDPPRAGQPAALSWTAQGGTTACVAVNGGAAVCGADMGHADLPAADFPSAGRYDLSVGRTLVGTDGQATLLVHVVRDVT